MLDAHPMVYGMGEDSHFNSGLGEFRDGLVKAISSNSDDATRKSLHSYAKLVVSKMVNESLNDVNNVDNIGGIAKRPKRVIDKMLFNYRNIGFIHLVFPKAVILHTVRDPMDTLLSCFRHKFDDSGLDWALDVERLTATYITYLKMVHHFKTVLPGRVFDVSYEALVTSTEKTIKGVIKEIGVEWSSDVLNFYEKNRTVHTHSMSQVRHRVSKSGVGGWRKYAEELKPMIAALRPELKKLKRSGALPFLSEMNWDLDPNFDYGNESPLSSRQPAEAEAEAVGPPNGKRKRKIISSGSDGEEEGGEGGGNRGGSEKSSRPRRRSRSGGESISRKRRSPQEMEVTPSGHVQSQGGERPKPEVGRRRRKKAISSSSSSEEEEEEEEGASVRTRRGRSAERRGVGGESPTGSDGSSGSGTGQRRRRAENENKLEEASTESTDDSMIRGRKSNAQSNAQSKARTHNAEVGEAEQASGGGPLRRVVTQWTATYVRLSDRRPPEGLRSQLPFPSRQGPSKEGPSKEGQEVDDLLVLAYSFYMDSLPAEAAELLWAAVGADGSLASEPGFQLVLTQVLLSENKYTECIPSATRLTELEPAFVDGHLALASALGFIGRFEEAVQALTTALAFTEGHEGITIQRGYNYFKMRKYKSAHADFSSVKLTAQNEANMLALIGKCEKEFGDQEAAIKSLTKSIRLDRQQADAHLDMGMYLFII
jgi:tetratricopeptide (TPR) repeat protein